MLGEKIGEGKGQVVSRRVLPAEGGGVRIEVSFQARSTVLGQDCTEIATYTAVPRPDGTLYGEGQGLITTDKGDLCTWKGTGIGRMEGATTHYRGSICFETRSPNLQRLNGVVGVFEHDVDKDGRTTEKTWEWR